MVLPAITCCAAAMVFLDLTGPKPGTEESASGVAFAIASADVNPCFFNSVSAAGPMPDMAVSGVGMLFLQNNNSNYLSIVIIDSLTGKLAY